MLKCWSSGGTLSNHHITIGFGPFELLHDLWPITERVRVFVSMLERLRAIQEDRSKMLTFWFCASQNLCQFCVDMVWRLVTQD